MSSTKPLKEALNGKPAPQYFNPDAQEYEYLLGKYGASRQILYGPDGNPITVTGSKLAIRASEIETLVGALTAAAVTDPAASAAVIQLLKGLLKQLQGAGTGAAPVQLTGSILDKVDLSNQLLASINHGQLSPIAISSWQEIQYIVRSGLGPKVFRVGDQFISQYDTGEVVWDVIGIDHDIPADEQYTHSLTLQAHDCIMNCQFDAPEALYFAEAELHAGDRKSVV